MVMRGMMMLMTAKAGGAVSGSASLVRTGRR